MALCPGCGMETGFSAIRLAANSRCPHCGRWLWCDRRKAGNVTVLDVVPGCGAEHGDMAELFAAIDGGSRTARIAVNLSQLDLVTSSFLAGLVGLWKRARAQGGCLVLFGLRPVVREVFHYTQLSGLFEICTDEVEALDVCRSHPVSTDLVPS